MLRLNGSNQWLNDTEKSLMEPLLGEFWNGSVSWTTTKGASTTLSFVGEFGRVSCSSPSFPRLIYLGLVSVS